MADAFAKRGADAEEAQYRDMDSGALWRTYSLSHLHRRVTEQPKITARLWIKEKLKQHKAYQPRKTSTFRQAFKPPWNIKEGKHPVSKTATAAFFQMACGHALTGAHLLRFRLKERGAVVGVMAVRNRLEAIFLAVAEDYGWSTIGFARNQIRS